MSDTGLSDSLIREFKEFGSGEISGEFAAEVVQHVAAGETWTPNGWEPRERLAAAQEPDEAPLQQCVVCGEWAHDGTESHALRTAAPSTPDGGLDVERLAKAIKNLRYGGKETFGNALEDARELAAEYVRLAAAHPQDPAERETRDE